MKISLIKEKKKQSFEAKKGATAREVMNELELNNETLIIKLNGQVAHPSEKLNEGDELEFVGVIYGG